MNKIIKSLLFTVLIVYVMSIFAFAQNIAIDSGVITPPDTGSGDLGVFGVAGALAIAINFILSALKTYAKLPTAWCPITAFGLGAIGGVVMFFAKMAPAGMTLVQCLISGVILGGTATGLYDVKKKVAEALYGEPK